MCMIQNVNTRKTKLRIFNETIFKFNSNEYLHLKISNFQEKVKI